MPNVTLDRSFALATIPFRPIQHLVNVEDQLSLLACARRHLEPGGKIALDVFHPDLKRLATPASPDEIEDTTEHELTDGRRLRRTFRLTAKSIAEQTNDAELIYYVRNTDGNVTRIVHSFPLRYFFRFELEHLLARAGLQITEFFGDFDRSPFTGASPEMIVIAACKD
jgi:hypothetical protein